jgi:hypothetical protein
MDYRRGGLASLDRFCRPIRLLSSLDDLMRAGRRCGGWGRGGASLARRSGGAAGSRHAMAVCRSWINPVVLKSPSSPSASSGWMRRWTEPSTPILGCLGVTRREQDAG